MGSVVSQQLESQTQVITNLLQEQQNFCKAQTNVVISGTTVIVDNAQNVDINGVSVNGTQTDGSCVMSNSMESQVEQVLKQSLSQSTKTQSDLFSMLEGLNFSINNSRVTEAIANNLTQYSQSACLADTSLEVSSTYLYVGNVKNGTINGVVINSITSNASCAMSNIGKIINFLEDSKDFSQNASKTGTLGSLMGVFGIIAIIIIGVIVLMIILSIFKGGKKGKEGSMNSLTYSELNNILDVANKVV